MKPELLGIPFDHFQRYAATAALVDSLGGDAATVLEVGANRQRLLDEFLPGRRIVFSDLEHQDCDDGRFVRADATELPFADEAFDSVVCLDVLEHIPVPLRAKAVSEMARVAGRLVVIACPLDLPWVHTAEENANRLWRDFQGGGNYPWLEEHKEFGLVAPDEVVSALSDTGWSVLRFGQGDCALWTSLMGAHFLKEAVAEFAPLVAAADRLYNGNVFAGDRSERAYREFFLAVRTEGDLVAIQRALPLVGTSDPASTRLLGSLAESMNEVVRRTRHAENSWAATAEVARQFEAKANEADRERIVVQGREATLQSQIDGAVEREAYLRQVIDSNMEREVYLRQVIDAGSVRETYLREHIEATRQQHVEAVAERASTAQRYADLLQEHRALIDAARHRWRMMMVVVLLLLIMNVALITAFVLLEAA